MIGQTKKHFYKKLLFLIKLIVKIDNIESINKKYCYIIY